MRLVQPVTLAHGDDGGLAHRQMFRKVMETMRSARFPRNQKIVCRPCLDAKSRNPHSFRSWDGLRSHLITFHDIDRRELPE